jgi:hypothetical protein
MSENIESSILAKIFGIFWEPSKTFKSLNFKTHWFDIVIPLVLIIAVGIAAFTQIKPIVLNERIAMVQKSERLNDTQKEFYINRITKQVNSFFTYIISAISIVIKYLIITLVMWFIGNIILGGEASFLPIWGMTLYTGLIDIISTAVKTPLILSQGTLKVYTSLALFLQESQTFLFRLAGAIDIFAIWKVTLLSFGLGVFYKQKAVKVFWLVLLFWLLYCILAAGLGSLVKI